MHKLNQMKLKPFMPSNQEMDQSILQLLGLYQIPWLLQYGWQRFIDMRLQCNAIVVASCSLSYKQARQPTCF